MAIFTTADGRQIVGAAQAGNEYKGYAGRREIVIQLTATGATQDSLDALEFLKSYALYHNSVGEPIFPASTNVFISNNGVTKAVEADEVTVDGANVNIGGAVWNGTAWDFTNAGQSGGGGSYGGGVLVVHETVSGTTHTLDKTAGEIINSLPCVYIDTVDEGSKWVQHDLKPLLYNQGGNNGQVWGYRDGMGYVFPITALGPDAISFVAATLNDYPSYTE